MKFSKFIIVGILGAITNVIIFYAFVDILGYKPLQVSAIGFLLASFQNYVLNHNWTFNHITKDRSIATNDYLKYLGIALIALSVNLFILQYILIEYQPEPKVIGQCIGIVAGTLINYYGAKLWVFRARN